MIEKHKESDTVIKNIKNGMNETMGFSRDTLFSKGTDIAQGSFSFDESIANVFLDMAHRSIPGYADIQNFTAEYVINLIQERNSLQGEKAPDVIFDIGTSLGTSLSTISTCALHRALNLQKCIAIACDSSESMLTQCENNIRIFQNQWNSIHYKHIDICNEEVRNSILQQYSQKSKIRVVIMHFVLQFTPISMRHAILNDIWNTMDSQSVLIISEKLYANTEKMQQVWDKLYKSFKKSMGYTTAQIQGKQKALMGVLNCMKESEFMTILQSLPNALIDTFFTWGPFRSYAVYKQ